MRLAVLGPQRDRPGYPLRSVTDAGYPAFIFLAERDKSGHPRRDRLGYSNILETQKKYIPRAWNWRVARPVTLGAL
jgi:hypothetical protein